MNSLIPYWMDRLNKRLFEIFVYKLSVGSYSMLLDVFDLSR